MKRTLCILILCAMLFAGCSQPGQAALPTETGTQPTETKTQQTEPTQTQMTANEILAEAEKWLEKDCGFIMNYRFMNPGVCGMQQRSEYVYCKDDSRAMVNLYQLQYPGEPEIQTEIGEFYYRYEGAEYVCYSRIDENAPQRFVLSDRELNEMNASQELMRGAACLMPDYLKGLQITQSAAEGINVLSYWLPVDKVMADGTMLSVFTNNAFALNEKTYPQNANARIVVMLQLDEETCQPLALTCYFHELWPYLLPESALTGDTIEDQELMIIDYRFDYDLQNTVPVPDDMIP